MTNFIQFLKDLIFPVFCIDCKKEGDWLCDGCVRELRGRAVVSHLDDVTTFFSYQDNIISELIKTYKYKSVRDINELWKKLLNGVEKNLPTDFADAIVIPIPLFKRRERNRGFNQAEDLGRIIAEKMGIKIECEGLRRGRSTAQQAGLTAEERRKNIEGAFYWSKTDLAPEKIVLVDDVYTTGSTMRECAKVLKMNGSKKVWGFAPARD